MAASLNPAYDAFTRELHITLDWLGATEALWLAAPPATDVRKRLKVKQLQALYESAFLRIFTAWEVFVEEVVIRHMAGAESSSYVPTFAPGKSKSSSLKAARQELYGNKTYLLWHHPDGVIHKTQSCVLGSPVEICFSTNRSWFLAFAAIRHRIAHASSDARIQFEAAAIQLSGNNHRGSPGRFLRAHQSQDSLNQKRWILALSQQLELHAQQIVS